MYADQLEQVEHAGLDLCVDCGLCSYVCPSKIELLGEIINARETVQRELHGDVGSEESQNEQQEQKTSNSEVQA